MHVHTHTPLWNHYPDQESEYIKHRRRLPPAKLGDIYFSLPSSGFFSIIMQKTLWGTYSLWHLIFLLTEGEKQMGHHLYIHPEFTTRPWRGRAWICWISSSMPGACATRWKEGGSKCKTSSVLAAHPIGSECLLFSRGPSSGHSFTPGFF